MYCNTPVSCWYFLLLFATNNCLAEAIASGSVHNELCCALNTVKAVVCKAWPGPWAGNKCVIQSQCYYLWPTIQFILSLMSTVQWQIPRLTGNWIYWLCSLGPRDTSDTALVVLLQAARRAPQTCQGSGSLGHCTGLQLAEVNIFKSMKMPKYDEKKIIC